MATDEEYLDNLLKAVTQETENRAEEKNDHIEEPEVPVAEPEQSELPSGAEAFQKSKAQNQGQTRLLQRILRRKNPCQRNLHWKNLLQKRKQRL